MQVPDTFHIQETSRIEILMKWQAVLGCTCLVDRMDDAELGRFLVAANGSMSNFVARVKKTVNWRERHHLFSPPELKRWEHLVYWHKHDVQQRPTLIVRLGPAYSTLDPADHPRFAQAAGLFACIFFLPEPRPACPEPYCAPILEFAIALRSSHFLGSSW